MDNQDNRCVSNDYTILSRVDNGYMMAFRAVDNVGEYRQFNYVFSVPILGGNPLDPLVEMIWCLIKTLDEDVIEVGKRWEEMMKCLPKKNAPIV